MEAVKAEKNEGRLEGRNENVMNAKGEKVPNKPV
jgi:hypothetical protein